MGIQFSCSEGGMHHHTLKTGITNRSGAILSGAGKSEPASLSLVDPRSPLLWLVEACDRLQAGLERGTECVVSRVGALGQVMQAMLAEQHLNFNVGTTAQVAAMICYEQTESPWFLVCNILE